MEYRQKAVRLPRSAEDKARWRRVVVILEHCPLAVVRTEWGFELLSEKHRAYHARNKQDPAEWRPDVVHQTLLHLLDSPLNRAGLLQVFLCTKKGVVIAVDPRLRVPRHMRLFEKMMVSCLYKMKVRAAHGYLSLLRVVRNPVTDHIPPNSTLIRVEKDGDAVPDLYAFCASCGLGTDEGSSNKNNKNNNNNNNAGASSSAAGDASTDFARRQRAAAEARQFRPFAFIVGGMSKGDVDAPYAAKGQVQSIRLGDRGMSAAAVCSSIVHAFEEEWLREDNEAE
ncbi:essential for mitotic growth 1 [Trypanosoma grayi]|uniref:essential for mitotic growth 1 n=1 Tax=Trypanosoma grayi TaxID=71804 RepID=UPI0004F453F2|nr:essential for mitotic growth 1 [Trypanosoma grayi]KEG05704.1 essential for mitotic growth 1 [Trypanosoma grayi]